MSGPRLHAIIPAAGAGRRLAPDSEAPKQYRQLLGKPMLRWSVERVLADARVGGVTLALAPDDELGASLNWTLDRPVHVAVGGDTRAHSVLNALRHARRETDPDWVLVHDAARPCLDRASLARLLDQGLADPVGAILAVPVSDTLKRAARGESRIDDTLDREGLWAAQTPQLFPAAALETALCAQIEAGAPPTDEAGAMEAAGHRPLLVPGSRTNLKVTWAADLALAEAILNHQLEHAP
jgi:2-C-methyl-D-erythritol 4-phosphate cytidylyltransferase